MHKWYNSSVHQYLKLLPHHHTGRLRPHSHTSYLGLGGCLLLIGAMLLQLSAASLASASPGPQSGSIGITGKLPAQPPVNAPTISQPINDKHFTTSPIIVAGTCQINTIVEVFKSDIFAGSTPCSPTGTYAMSIDLLYGQNVLVARVYDALDQPGPDSTTVTVFYDAVAPQSIALSSNNFFDRQLLIQADAAYRGTFPGQQLNLGLTLLGGQAPFAVNIQWGDNANTVVSRTDNLSFTIGHTYQKPGTYPITIQASDAQNHVAFLQIAAIINGPVSGAGTTNGSSDGSDSGSSGAVGRSLIVTLWPLYAVIVAIVIGFWLGEMREKRVLSHHLPHGAV